MAKRRRADGGTDQAHRAITLLSIYARAPFIYLFLRVKSTPNLIRHPLSREGHKERGGHEGLITGT